MVRVKNGAMEALFHSINNDGANWLFLILSDDEWAITRNRERFTVDVSHRASVSRDPNPAAIRYRSAKIRNAWTVPERNHRARLASRLQYRFFMDNT